MKKKTEYFKALVIPFALLLIWFVLSKLNIFSSYVFPSPMRVWNAFYIMLKSGELFKHLGISFLRVIIGFVISFVLGFLLAVIASVFPKADPYYRPILEFLRNIPPMSLIPLLILWFGIGETSKIIVIVLTSFFPIFMNSLSGLQECDKKLLEVGQMLHMSKGQIFTKINIPAALPSILVGMRIGLGYSWRAIVGAEMIAAVKGLGYMILDAQAMSRTDKVLVGIILIGLTGLVTDKIFGLLIKKFSVNQEAAK